MWILSRCEDKVDARETAIGYVPYAKDINVEGLSIGMDTLEDLLSVDNNAWKEDIVNIKDFYAQVGERVPAELYEELKALEERLSK
jgi:phosphoenolpyruvate carboxykinase (GTP)